MTVGTGMAEHNNYAVEFFNAVRELKRLFPLAKTSGGVIDSCPGQKGQTSRATTDSLTACVNESGRRARSVATATHRPVIKSCRN